MSHTTRSVAIVIPISAQIAQRVKKLMTVLLISIRIVVFASDVLWDVLAARMPRLARAVILHAT